jgi:aspartate/methionine/tyrosine aminotransferase
MDNTKFDRADLIAVVKACTHSRCAGSLLSTSKAIEELRIRSGDFVTPDEEMAEAISKAAIVLGCTIVFDERAGADTLNMTPRQIGRRATQRKEPARANVAGLGWHRLT